MMTLAGTRWRLVFCHLIRLTILVIITQHHDCSCVHNTRTGINHNLYFHLGNMLFLAETIGQMVSNGIFGANQWDLANGCSSVTGSCYDLLQVKTSALQRINIQLAGWNRSLA